jgi:hypothetical protein
MNIAIRFACWLLLLTAAVTAFADEQVRQVQEELRRRNLYFGDIDGQATPELATALKRYQERKGFTPTGQIDEVTANSLSVQLAAATTPNRSRLPDMPVLKSDSARELPAAQRIALEQQAEANVDFVPTPAPPAEEPPPSQDLSPERVTKMVEQYLHDSETDDVEAQTRYFSFPVDYFDHGQVGREFTHKDVMNYVKRWPERKYTLTEPVSFVASTNEGETTVEFTIGFNVRNKEHVATGHTKNFWTIRPEGDELKIVSIREQRLREH